MSKNLNEIPFDAYKGDESYIFVSYSHQDSDIVFNDIKRLHDTGYRIWYDEGISPTQEWSEEIATALQKSAIFVFFVSPRSVESKSCRDEAYFALDIGKPFLAIYLEQTDLPGGLKLRMNRIQAIMKHQLPAKTYDKKLERVLDAFNAKALSGLQRDVKVAVADSPSQESLNTAPLTEAKRSIRFSTYLNTRWLWIGGTTVAVLILFLWALPRSPVIVPGLSSTANTSISPSNTPTPDEVPKVNPSTYPPGSIPAVNLEGAGYRNVAGTIDYPLGEPDRPGRSGTTPDQKAASLTNIIEWLDVEHSQRYAPKGTHTSPNIYAFDYCYLAGVYLPRVWWSDEALEKLKQGYTVSPKYGVTVDELSSNGVFKWLIDYEPAFGWKHPSDIDDLQKAANEGKVAIICARYKDVNKPGHISIVVPETNDHRAVRTDGVVTQPLQSRAGSQNHKYVTDKWWGDSRYTVMFWIHD